MTQRPQKASIHIVLESAEEKAEFQKLAEAYGMGISELIRLSLNMVKESRPELVIKPSAREGAPRKMLIVEKK